MLGVQVCGAERWAGVKSSSHHFFHLREGNPKTSSPVPGGYNPGPQGKEAVRNTGFSYPPSCLVPGWVWEKYKRDSSSDQWGHRAGFIALQQSLNKSRVSRAEGRGGEDWAKRGRAASVQLAGRTQILQARESGLPFSGGLGGPAFGQAEVPDLLPSWPLQSPGQFLTSPESEVDWASRPRCLVQVQMLS